jgi:hypothetical protein
LRRSERLRPNLIRFFNCFLNLYQTSSGLDNGAVTPHHTLNRLEAFMGKLALYLLGFLALAIGVGLLGTISPL